MGRVIHFEVEAEDIPRARSFYETVLGWRIAKWGGAVEYWLAETRNGGEGIDGAIMPTTMGAGVIITAEVDDIELAMELVWENGGEVVTERNVVPGVGIHCYCRDPEGNMFGMMQPLPR